MQIIKSLKPFNENIAIAIGFFDGVHLAHQKVIAECVKYSKANNLKSAVLTFKDHPCVTIWNKKPEYINSLEQRLQSINSLEVDYVFLLDFNKELCNTTAESFIEVLMNSIKPKAIFTGYNFSFGKNKAGTPELLKKYSLSSHYEYVNIPEQKINGTSISSTNIRNSLKNGDISTANAMLGSKFSFTSTVIHGQEIGRTLGFPTANLVYPNDIVNLKYGVYSVKIELDGQIYDGIMNFGKKPTINKSPEVNAEVHILNFDQNIYDKEITIYVTEYIREEKKFASPDELKKQISIDISNIISL